jgi:hypothetical protein
VRATLLASVVVLGIAALVHFVRYLLLIINRSTLLNSLVARRGLARGISQPGRDHGRDHRRYCADPLVDRTTHRSFRPLRELGTAP